MKKTLYILCSLLMLALHGYGQVTVDTYLMHKPCSGDTLYIEDKAFTQTGTDTLRFKKMDGTDSVVVHIINFQPSYMSVDKRTITFGESTLWRGNTYKPEETTTYYDTLTTVNGCDSILALEVTVKLPPVERHYIDLCQGESIVLKGIRFSENAVFRDTLYKNNGIEKIYEYIIDVHPTYIFHDTIVALNEKAPILWHGQEIWTSGTYKDKYTSVYGCDSVYELKMEFVQTYLFVTDTAVCQNNLPYYWRGKECGVIGETHTYEDKFVTIGDTPGLDSIYRLNITVYPAYEFKQRIGICEGERQEINGKFYTNLRTDTIYRDTVILRSSHKCDSIIYYEIFQYPTKRNSETRILHVGDTIEWNGQTITTGGLYTDVQQQASNGCDSINELVVIAEHADTAYICALDTPYIWRNMEFRSGGNYTDTVFDDLHHIAEFHSLNLVMQIPVDTTIFLRGCENFGVDFNNVTYFADTAFVDTLACDTIFRVNIKIDSVQIITINDTVCEQDLPYILGAQEPDTIWQEGSFIHTDYMPDGCEMTTYFLTLRILPDLKKNDSIIVCERILKENPVILGDTAHPWFDTKEGGRFHGTWEGKWTGLPFTEDTIVYNCDSSYFFHVIMRPEQRMDSVYNMCEGDSIQFGFLEDGVTWRWIKDAGIYEDTIPSITHWDDPVHGGEYFLDTLRCDSIVRLTVNILPTYKDTIEKHLPIGDSIYWGGEMRYYTGVYDSIADLDYMDSRDTICKFIHTLKLFMDSAYHYRDTLEICEVENKTLMHEWATGYQQSFTVPDKDSLIHFIDSLVTEEYRFDSIYDLYVNYKRVPLTYLETSICEGDSLRFGLTKSHEVRFLHVTGNYTDTLVNPLNGCDSIVTLHLNVFPRHKFFNEVHIVDTDTPYVWHHEWIGENGIPVDSTRLLYATDLYECVMKSVHGCDSIDSLSLVVHQSYKFIDSVKICYSETPYQWFDVEDIYTTGWYSKYYRTQDGYADSVYMRYIEVIPVPKNTISYTICEGDFYLFNNKALTTSGIYTDTLLSSLGCDSIVTLNLTVAKPYYNTIVKHLVEGQGQTYTFYDKVYTDQDAGVYKHQGKLTADGCDSITELRLIVHPAYDTLAVICAKDLPFHWINKWTGTESLLYESGIYRNDSVFINNEQMFYGIKLEVNLATDTILYRQICEGSEYDFNGQKLNKQGEYRDTLVNANGCDSIITLHLNVQRPYYHTIERTIYEGDTVHFENNVFSEAGNYPFRYLTELGCDSVIELQLTVLKLYDDSVSVCFRDLPYVWHGQEIYTTGLYRDTIIGSDNKPVPTGVKVTVLPTVFAEEPVVVSICEGDEYNFRGRFLTESGTYYDTLTAVNGCDSIVMLTLQVNNKYYNTINRTIYEGDTVHFENNVFSEAGNYPFRYLTELGCDSVIELQLTVLKLYDDSVSVCFRDLPYVWHGQEIYTTGLYRDTIVGSDNKPVPTGIKVTVLPTVFAAEPVVVSICEGDEYNFRGRFLTESGTYYDTLTAVNGCDSIVMLTLQVNNKYYNTINRTIYEGDTVHFENNVYSEAGNYPFRYTSAAGCDSIIELHLVTKRLYDDSVSVCVKDLPYVWQGKEIYVSGLYRDTTYSSTEEIVTGIKVTVLPTAFTAEPIVASICEGDEYNFRGIFLTESGTYYDTLTAVNGCDSIVMLTLQVNNKYHNTINRTIYVGDTVHFENNVYSEGGNYPFRYTSAAGCDSIIELHLVTKRLYDDSVSVCVKDLPFEWRNRTIYESGIYRDTIYSDGNEVVTGIKVTVLPTAFTAEPIVASICEGDEYNFRGIFLTESGTYYDTLTAVNGCDSIVMLTLQVNNKYHNTINRTIYVGDTVHFENNVYSEGGNYPFRYTSAAGCDSIIELHLVTKRLYDDSVSVCVKDLPFEWRNRTIYESGIYRDTIYSDGNEVVLGIKVTVLPTAFTAEPVVVSICEGDEYNFRGRFLTESGTYFDTLTAVNGCDSIVMLTLQVNSKYYNSVNRTIYEGDTVHFENNVYSEAGNYPFRYTSAAGCDSIIELHLVTKRLYDDSVSVCVKDLPFVWRGNEIYVSGLYRDTTYSGLEEIVTGIKVTVLPTAYTAEPIVASICEGDVYNFRGRFLTENGTYFDTLTAVNGCDSIVMLSLQVHDKYYHSVNRTIYEGDTVHFENNVYSEAGNYPFRYTSAAGCDSIIELHLVTKRLYEDSVSICSDALPYEWRNRTIYESGIYRDTVYSDGNEVVLGIKVTVLPVMHKQEPIVAAICEGDVYNFRGRFLTESGTYFDTLTAANGCDSIVMLSLQVHNKYYHSVNRTIYEGDTVHFENNVYSEAGNYPFRYTSAAGCDSIIELHLVTKRLYEDSVSICADALPYEWRGRTIYESGIYRDTVYSDGNEVVQGIKVTVLPVMHKPEPILATICDGDFYQFGDSMLTVQGTYFDTLTSVNGCDSIVMLTLQILPVTNQVEHKSIFEGDSVLFHDVWYKEPGFYTYREKNINSCTNTYQLILNVIKEFKKDTAVYVCDNELPFVWRGIEYYETGDYTRPTSWTDSSRVMTTLHLTVSPTYYGEQHINLCSGAGSFLYRGKEYTETGIFYDTIPSRNGCDSIYKIIVRVHPTKERFDTVHISDKQTYNFNGRDLNKEGQYEAMFTNEMGCDSIIHLQLYVHPSYLYETNEEICEKDTFIWRGKKYFETGVYHDSLLSVYGHDSVYKLSLIVHPSYVFQEEVTVCPNRTTYLHGIDISQPGMYHDTLQSIHGCDSVYHIMVNWARSFQQEYSATICQGEKYNFYGVDYTRSGTYKYEIGCDSTIILHLTVLQRDIVEKRVVISDEDLPYRYGGNEYMETGIYSDTMHNVYGCDSIFRLNLIVSTHNSPWYQIPLCPGSEIKIDTMIITKSGLYQFLRRSQVSGLMDSLYRVEVYDAPAYDLPVDSITICQGDTLFYGEREITRPGWHHISLKTKEGCDSLLHLFLTVNPSYHFDTVATITDYQSCFWRGREYTESGDHIVKFATVKDCDSIYSLRLTVVPTKRIHIEDTICMNGRYIWRGDTITEEGLYIDTVCQLGTYTSAIYSLHLVVQAPTVLRSASVKDVCADAEYVEVSFNYTGALPTSYSLIFDQRAKSQGFEDVINQRFMEDMVARAKLPTFTTLAYLEHTQYVRPDNYTVRLVFNNGFCDMSHSDTLPFVVKYPSWILEQNWNDVVAPLSSTYNGGFDFAKTEWYVNGSRVTTNGLSYLHQDGLREGDEVYMVATRVGESAAIPTCPLVITKPPFDAYTTPVLVQPTQAPRHMPDITIVAPQEGSFDVYSFTGTLIMSGSMETGETVVSLPAVSGVYFIRTTSGKETLTHKVLIY